MPRKPQIAIELCYRFRDQHPEAHALWVPAGSVSLIEDAYRHIARRLLISGWEDSKVSISQLVSECLMDMTERWLLVFDNADDAEVFFPGTKGHTDSSEDIDAPCAQFFPLNASYGSIIITTRNADLGRTLSNNESSIVIPPMPIEDAKSMVSAKIARDISDVEVERLVTELDCLPLALMQAAAYISKNHKSIKEYLQLLRDDDCILDKEYHDLRRVSGRTSVIRTWRLSFNLIRRQMPRAADVLSLMAVLDRQ